MFSTAKLRGRIIEKFGSQKSFAKAANKPVGFVSQYLNGHKILNQKVMFEWIALLEIPESEIDSYFFNKRVYDGEQ